MDSQKTGRLGEDVAVRFLERKGYQILDRNFQRKVCRFLKSEIDIVAKKEEVVVFVEVKTLRKNDFQEDGGFFPEEKVNFRKKQKIIRTAQEWLLKKRIPLESKWQIDVIAVEIGRQTRKVRIHHFENAVSQNEL